jgi:hypothetical protein
MDAGAGTGDGQPRGGLPWLAGVLLRIVLVFGAGLGMGVFLTAPIVGWPHAVPGLLIGAPESIRDTVGLLVMFGTPLVCLVRLRRWIAR